MGVLDKFLDVMKLNGDDDEYDDDFYDEDESVEIRKIASRYMDSIFRS